MQQVIQQTPEDCKGNVLVQSINLDLGILDVIPAILFIAGVAIVRSSEHDFLSYRNSAFG